MFVFGFRYKKIYDKHIQMHQTGGSDKFQCPICKIKFMDDNILQKHLAVHISANIKQGHITSSLVFPEPVAGQADVMDHLVEPSSLVPTGLSGAVLQARAAHAEEALQHLSAFRSNNTHMKPIVLEDIVKKEVQERSVTVIGFSLMNNQNSKH